MRFDVCPVHLARGEVERDSLRLPCLPDEGLDIGAVEICAPNADPLGRPVHLVGSQIESDSGRNREPIREDEILDARAVGVGALYLAGSEISPVHLACGRVERDPVRIDESAGDEDLHARAIGVGAPDLCWCLRPSNRSSVRKSGRTALRGCILTRDCSRRSYRRSHRCSRWLFPHRFHSCRSRRWCRRCRRCRSCRSA